MDNTRQIYWHSGQYLDPQHLQQTDLFHCRNAAGYAAHFAPFCWGVDECLVDPSSLAEGRLEFLALSLRFQDGSAVVCRQRSGNAVVFPCSLKEVWHDQARPCTLYAALCHELPEGNVAGILGQIPAGFGRFLASENDESLPDRYALSQEPGQPQEALVRTLYYWVRLYSEAGVRGLNGHDFFPLLRLVRNGSSVSVDPDFVPPLLGIHASPFFSQRLRRLRARLVGMNQCLRAAVPLSLFESVATPALLLLQASESCIMDLDSFFSRERVPPWVVFDSLRRALGAMLPLVPNAKTTANLVPVYRHLEAGPCFDGLLGCFDEILHLALPTPLGVCSFTPEEDWLVTSLPETCLSTSVRPILIVQSEGDPEQLIAGGRLMLGSVEDIRETLRYAVPTLPLKVLDIPPPGLSRKKGIHYIEPDTQNLFWKAVIAEGRIAVAFFPDESMPPEKVATRVRLVFLSPE